MRKIILGTITVLLMALLATSCGMEVEYNQVPFEEIHGTCKLNPSKVSPSVIYTRSELDNTYSNVSPVVDMASNFIIMVCAPKGGPYTGVRIKEVMSKDASMYVKYSLENSGVSPDAGCPHAAVAVSSSYAGYDISFFDVSGK